MKLSPLVLALCGLALAGASQAAPPPRAPNHLRFVPFEVLVKFKSETQLSAAKAQMPDVSLGGTSSRVRLAKLSTPASRAYSPAEMKTETLALLDRLRRRTDVEYAQLNYLIDLAYVPNDPLYAQQWHYPPISMPGAWDITRGSAAVRIAILDTGRTAHPDLATRWSALEFNAAAPGTAATDNGTWRHGTHVAGIAGAETGNGVGGAGVCPNCQLLNVKISDNSGGITIERIVSGIHWAIDNGAGVINMSLEAPSACTQASFPALREAIDRAVNNGVNVVAAAGNNAVNVDNVTPASCPGVISVAATDRNNALAAYSSRGANVGIAAPGGGGVHTPPYSGYGQGIGCPTDANSFFYPFTEGALSTWTTSPTSGNVHCYRFLSGTSMATPHVAGAIGLMLSANAKLRPDQVRTLLRTTTTALPACGANCGPGLLNVQRAVSGARVATTGPCSANPVPGSQCKIDGIAQYRNSAGALVESVYAYGQLWQFNASGAQIGVTRNLRGLPRYASGPCAYAPAGQPCVIDSIVTMDFPGIGYVESVSAYGRGWNFDVNGNPWPANNFLLSSIARYAAGPCAYAGSSTTCKFDTRTLIYAPEWGLDGLFESITAYGRYWIFSGAGQMLESNPLLNVTRYANGPCAYRPSGTTCKFDSLDLQRMPNGAIYETITAYGRYFEWDGNGVPTANHGLPLQQVTRFK